MDDTDVEHFHLCRKFLYSAALGGAYISETWMVGQRWKGYKVERTLPGGQEEEVVDVVPGFGD